MRNLLGYVFGFLSDLINGAERSFLDFLSALVPYFVPIIPAYLTFYHTTDQMDFPTWVAATAAFVVEVLGIAAVSTAIRFWYHNKRYSDSKNHAPFWLAVGVYVFYIVIVLAVNVILEIVAGARNGWIILAIALFCLLSFPSGVLISIRAQYGDVLDSIQKRHAPRAENLKPIPQGGTYREKHASDYREKILGMLDAEYGRSGKVLAPKDITSRLKLDHTRNKGFVSTLTSTWKSSKGIL